MLTKLSLGRRFGAVDRPQLAAQYCGQGTEDRATTYDWIVDVRSFFTDLCTEGTEPGSPLAQHMPGCSP